MTTRKRRGGGDSIVAIILFLSSIFIFQNSAVVLGLVTDYQVVTWNSRGYRLPEILTYMENHQNIHSVFIQESGNTIESTRNIRVFPVPINQRPRLIIADGTNEHNGNFDHYLQIGYVSLRNGQQLFIYYSPAIGQASPQFSDTIVSRQLVQEVMLFPTQHAHNELVHDRSHTNHPIMGLIIPNNHGTNDILLNIHAEPDQTNNELIMQLSFITEHMNNWRSHDSWLLMGDMNRDPSTVEPFVDPVQEQIVVPNAPTRLNTFLDYAIYGSSDQQSFREMQQSNYHSNVMDDQRTWLIGSDHRPVHFTNYLTSITYDARNLQNLLKQNYCKRSVNDENCDNNFKNWSDFYINLNMENEPLSTINAKSFADGSRIQPIVADRNLTIIDSSSWIPRNIVDRFFKNYLQFVTLENNHIRRKRSVTGGQLEGKVFHYGIIIIDKNKHPVMTVFHDKDKLICLKWMADSRWSAPSTCDKTLALSQFAADNGFDICSSDGGDNVVDEAYTHRLTDLYKRNIKHLNLDVLIRNFERTVNHDGFYFNNYASWQDYYNDKKKINIREEGINLSGKSKYFFYGNRYWNFGYYFNDGSFCIGFHSDDLQPTDRDNWIFINDNTLQDWREKTYSGMFFFDKMGRPTTLVVVQSYCIFFRCVWVYDYEEGDSWKWISPYSDTRASPLSRNTEAPKFYVNKKDVNGNLPIIHDDLK